MVLPGEIRERLAERLEFDRAGVGSRRSTAENEPFGCSSVTAMLAFVTASFATVNETRREGRA